MNTNKIITISNGPQFHDGKSAYLFVLLIILLFTLLGCIVNTFYIGILIILPVVILLSNYTLDIRGIQIDLTDQLVRKYKQNIWGKKGEWMDLKKFDKLVLIHEFYKVKSTDFIEEESYTTTHGHFVVRLIGTKSKESLIVTEEIKYSPAKKILAKTSKETGIEVEDTYHAKLLESMNMRSWQ